MWRLLKATGKVVLRLNEFAGRPSEVILKATTLILAGVIAGASPFPVKAAPRDPVRSQTILVLGDSLSDGFGLARTEAYPALLVGKAKEAGYEVKIVNASVSGGTSAGGLQRLPKYLAGPIDILVVQLGINDAFHGVPVPELRANLQAIIDRTRKRHPAVRVVIAGMQLPLNANGGYFDEFGKVFAEVAEKNAAALVPYLLAGVGGDPTLNLPDHIHPNAAGQRILAETVWRVLEPLLCERDNPRTATR